MRSLSGKCCTVKMHESDHLCSRQEKCASCTEQETRLDTTRICRAQEKRSTKTLGYPEKEEQQAWDTTIQRTQASAKKEFKWIVDVFGQLPKRVSSTREHSWDHIACTFFTEERLVPALFDDFANAEVNLQPLNACPEIQEQKRWYLKQVHRKERHGIVA